MKQQEHRRLVMLVPAFPQLSETFIVAKFLGLLARGWDVHIVCSRSEEAQWGLFAALQKDPAVKARVHLQWPHHSKALAALLLLPAIVRGFLRAPQAAWTYLRRGFRQFGIDIFRRYYLDQELICLQPDIIHFEFGALAVEKTYLKDLLMAKLSVSFRGYDLNFAGLDQENYYAHVWQQTDACHFLGEDLWKRAQRRGCPTGMPHMLIPPAVDLSAYPSASRSSTEYIGSSERPLRVLSVGRLEWKKGYEFGLQAVQLLKAQGINVEYHIIGSGRALDVLCFARYQLGLDAEVEFCGALAHEAVLEALSWADVFLHPAVSEGFCNAVLEAQVMGVPVVCSDADGLTDNIADGVSGFVVPRRDAPAMAAKIAILAADPDLRQRMGAAGRQRVADHFQLEAQLDAWERFYKDLL